MSRSSPPPSSTAGSSPADDLAAGRPIIADRPAPAGQRLFRLRLAAFLRWLHIYLSMFGLAALLFFSLTGLTLNHPNWFGDGIATSREAEGQMEVGWLQGRATTTGSAGASDPSAGPVAKLEVVEHLRQRHGIRGALADFSTDEHECLVSFKGPGYAADAFIDRQTGRYRLTEERHGLLAVVNDLHKGRDTGPVWSIVIDLSAALMAVVSLSGLLLLFYIKRRRRLGLLTALVGLAVLATAFVLGVP
ncbi:MAG: PepSY-associated TM helix domain-containing protein [Isosphaeraceae bacterium]|nr:PepSY-associated TM helix domain-containing protein [Isosphaeraceae bacterium]